MVYQSQPSEKLRELVKKLGGSIWTSVTDVAAGGTATAATRIEQPYVPDDARTLLGWRPVEYATDQAVAESLLSVFSIEGSNYKFQPQEVVCGSVGDSILLTGGILHTPSEYYDVLAPVSGGEQIDIYVEPCDAIAGNRRSAAEFTWTNVRVPLPTIYSKASREVAISLAGLTAGTTLNISRTHELIEVGGIITHAAHTVEEEAFGTLVIKSTNFTPIQEIKCLLEPTGAISDLAADENSPMVYLARRCQRMKFKTENSVVTADFDLDVAQSNAGQAVHYIRWI